MSDKKEIYTPGEGEYTEKKSRFLGIVSSVKNEEEAVAFIEAKRKQYHDARHNCSAYILEDENGRILSRYSDDGEPQGTAGMPILEVLEGAHLVNTICVVTRYFGGVLLGTGGLVRSYTNAAKAAIDNAALLEKHEGLPLTITTDYNGYGRIEYLLRQEDIPIADTSYAVDVDISCVIPFDKKESLEAKLSEATGGSVLLDYGEKRSYGLYEGRIIWL